MIIIVGLVILIAAVVAGVAGVLGNGGIAHSAGHFAVLGYHVNGSGSVFLAGLAVGAAGLLGLTLLLAGARRTSRRGRQARSGLRQSRRETAAATEAHDKLLGERLTDRASAASAPGSGAAAHDIAAADDIVVEPVGALGDGPKRRLHGLSRRFAAWQAPAAMAYPSPSDQPAPAEAPPAAETIDPAATPAIAASAGKGGTL